MNWYSKITKLAISYTEKLTTQIVREIFQKVKNREQVFEVKVDGVPGIGIVSVVINVKEGISFATNASYYPQLDIVGVTIDTPTKIEPSNYQNLYWDLYEVIRHEIEHVFTTQKDPMGAFQESLLQGESKLTGFRKAQEIVRYYTSPQEVPSLVSGYYYTAKKARKPFISIVDGLLQRIFKTLTSKGIDRFSALGGITKIRAAWLDYASNRFPKAQVE